MIDPRAVIDPAARLATDVRVGAFAIIGPDVEIDSGSEIGAFAYLQGPTRIGRDNRIFPYATVGGDPQDKKYQGEVTRLEIGDRNVVREYCTIHRGTVQDQSVTRIGHDNLFMAYTHIAHDCVIGSHVIMANAASLAGHVHLEDWAILGGFTLVHQFCRLGAHSFAAMGSIITRDVPPYVMVGGQPTCAHGINAVGLERRGFTPESIRAIRRAYKTLYKSGLTLETAVQSIRGMTAEHPEVSCLVDFVQASERSILR